MRQMRRVLLLLAAALALASPACFSAGQRREEALTREARMFTDDLRWARWQAVIGAMARAEGEAFAARVATLEDEIELGDEDITAINFAPGAESATVVARLQWFYKRDLRARSTVVEQQWEYHSGRWQVMKLRRLRGERLGLVTEPLKLEKSDAGPPGPDAL
jgi:hypothetical protein